MWVLNYFNELGKILLTCICILGIMGIGPKQKEGSTDDILSFVELKERGRITIPSKIRKDRGWTPGNHLLFSKRKCFLVTPDNVEELVKAVKENGNAKKTLVDSMGDRVFVHKASLKFVDELPPEK